MSLIASLIDYFQIAICRCLYCWAQRSFLHKINLTAKPLFQFAMHTRKGKQTDGEAAVELYQQVHVAVLALLTAGEGSENPCFQDGLRLEIVGYLLGDHLGTHNSCFSVFVRKYTNYFRNHQIIPMICA